MTFAESIQAEIARFNETVPTATSLRRFSKFILATSQALALMEKKTVKDADAVLQSGDLGSGGYPGGMGVISGQSVYGGGITEDDEGVQQGSFTPSSNSENFGSKAIREIMALAPSLITMSRDSPTALVNAIADARAAGMTDVAAELEKKLCGKSLDGPRPVSLAPDPVPPAELLTRVAAVAAREAVEARECQLCHLPMGSDGCHLGTGLPACSTQGKSAVDVDHDADHDHEGLTE